MAKSYKKYENGYYGKIEFYTEYLNAAIAAKDIKQIQFLMGKLQYFVTQQERLEAKATQPKKKLQKDVVNGLTVYSF